MANTGTLNSMKSNEETSKMYTGIKTKTNSDIEDQGPGGVGGEDESEPLDIEIPKEPIQQTQPPLQQP